MKTDVDNIYF